MRGTEDEALEETPLEETRTRSRRPATRQLFASDDVQDAVQDEDDGRDEDAVQDEDEDGATSTGAGARRHQGRRVPHSRSRSTSAGSRASLQRPSRQTIVP